MPEPRPAAARGAEGVRRAARRRTSPTARPRCAIFALLARAARAVQAHPAASSSPSCRRRSPARSAASSCAPVEQQRAADGTRGEWEWRERSFPNCGRSLRSFLPTRMCGPNHREGATPARVLGHLCPDVPHVRWVRRVWIDAESAIAAPAQSAGARSGAIKLAHRTPGPLHRTPFPARPAANAGSGSYAPFRETFDAVRRATGARPACDPGGAQASMSAAWSMIRPTNP